jgi:class 3 adenylate cyclase
LTDIERSTRLAERLGDRYAPMLKDVRALVRDAGRRRGGRRVDSHGGEYLTVFETPEGAPSKRRSRSSARWPSGGGREGSTVASEPGSTRAARR